VLGNDYGFSPARSGNARNFFPPLRSCLVVNIRVLITTANKVLGPQQWPNKRQESLYNQLLLENSVSPQKATDYLLQALQSLWSHVLSLASLWWLSVTAHAS
jgi:hypothetical protein